MGQSDYRFLFRIDDHSYFLPNEHFPETENFTYHSVRAVRGNESIPKHQRYAILTGKHLSDWYRDTRFCGCCGSPLRHAETQRAMVCDNCQRHFYPRIMPAVIVGVIRDEQLLLTRYRTGFAYNALIAGFTEIGETLEELPHGSSGGDRTANQKYPLLQIPAMGNRKRYPCRLFL